MAFKNTLPTLSKVQHISKGITPGSLSKKVYTYKTK